ncbi:MAG: triose-phosphate isomerase [Chitinophagales bacterium]
MKRKKLIAGNWKMYKTAQEAETTVAEIANEMSPIGQSDVWIGAPYLYLQVLISRFQNSGIIFGAQNCYSKEEGAYTGEVSARMLQSIGCNFVILGHSERRQYFLENDAFISEKIKTVLEHKMIPVYCCGETLEQRNADSHFKTIQQQIETALFSFSKEAIQNLIIAYEPVWAIGTGVNASPEQAQEMHAFIRKQLEEKFGKGIAESIRILYGGSVKPVNAKDLFAQQDIDGGLIGGASLVAKDFLSIIKAAE